MGRHYLFTNIVTGKQELIKAFSCEQAEERLKQVIYEKYNTLIDD